MIATAPTLAQVREQVAAVRQKVRDARVIGIRADTWEGPERIEVGDSSFRVAVCRSPLHVREELLELGDGAGLVLLTPLSDHELGADVMARLAKRQVFDIDTWRIALDLFQARMVDPRVQRARWLADALVESAPPSGYPPVATGVLDADTIWDVLLRRQLGMADGRPDALALMRWSDAEGATASYQQLPTEFREGVRQRIEETAGAAGLAMLDAIEIATAADLLSLGLACRVLFQPDAPTALREAAVRFEQYHRRRPLRQEAALHWAEAAERVLVERESELGWAAVRPRTDRADRLLRELGAEAFLFTGRWSPGGLEQRLTRFAEALSSSASERDGVSPVENAAQSVLEHRLVRFQESRARRVEMARRLARWIRRPPGDASASLSDVVEQYCRDGALVDFARLALLGGEQPPELGTAYADLLGRARELREAQNARFGSLLAAAGGCATRGEAGLVPVERALEDLVAPVARSQPILLLVMDGMSRPVYHDLIDAIVEDGWRLWKPESVAEGGSFAALAAVPTITAVSRTSLFCGRIAEGNASDERRGFAGHPALLSVSRAGKPPALFHKGGLLETSGRGLSQDVRSALSDTDQKVVGVVLNVVDDLLFKGDQIQPRWQLDTAPLLREIFDAARTTGRIIILTSDHGHLLDDDSTFAGREAGERWRDDDGQIREGEVRVEGRRVLGRGRSSVIVPWSERVRYTPKRNGYHGGVSPQEAILPLAVLTWGEAVLAGFVDAPVVHPNWWYEPVHMARRQRPAAFDLISTPAPRAKRPARPLLDAIEAPPSAASPEAGWVAALIASERYAEQRALSSGRGLPSDDEVGSLLTTLAERGGTMTKKALGQRLGLAHYRLNGLLVATRRLLNVDGLAVLDIDENADSVTVNRGLLQQQFELQG
jgi:hypothetical protein